MTPAANRPAVIWGRALADVLPFRVVLTEADVGGGPAAEFRAELIGTAGNVILRPTPLP